MYTFLDFPPPFSATMNLDVAFASWTLYSDYVKVFIYDCDGKLFPFCLRASMHNFDNLLFIKENVSIFKTAAFLIYLQGSNIKLQKERKSRMKENVQSNLKLRVEGINFSGLYKLCLGILMSFSYNSLSFLWAVLMQYSHFSTSCSTCFHKSKRIVIVFYIHIALNPSDRYICSGTWLWSLCTGLITSITKFSENLRGTFLILKNIAWSGTPNSVILTMV